MHHTVIQNFLGGQSESLIIQTGVPWIVLIPGSFDDARYWQRIAQFLPDAWGVVVCLLPGHSQSSTAYVNESIQTYTALTLEMINNMGIDQFYIGGHSIGGMMAIQMAADAPERVKGVISCEGWTHYTVAAKAFNGDVLGKMTPQQMLERDECRASTQCYFTQDEKMNFGKIWMRWSGLSILEQTTIPILELWGTRGKALPSRQAMMIPERDNIKLHWFYGVGHCLTQMVPRGIAEEIIMFVSETDKIC